MNRLVALAIPGGPAFVDELRRAWDSGDAVLPLDLRLPRAGRDELISELGASVVVDPSGRHEKPGRPVEPGDALVIATSGSTGRPKGVVLTHEAVAASARATNAALGVTAADHWLGCLPLSHVGGLAVVTRALHGGIPLTVHDGFDAAAVRAAAGDGATLTSLVPTTLGRIDPSLFRTILLGGSAPPPDRPENVIATYGMTETGSGVVYEGVPLDGVELRIVDGEIEVRGPMLFRGYRAARSAGAGGNSVDEGPVEESLVEEGLVEEDQEQGALDPDGWFATADMGELVEGKLQVFGRRDDVVISGGENVWPAPVEALLDGVPGVAEVAVVGRDDPEWGQVVTAVVVPADAAAPPELDALRAVVLDQLAPANAPRALELVEALPRTATGKVIRSSI